MCTLSRSRLPARKARIVLHVMSSGTGRHPIRRIRYAVPNPPRSILPICSSLGQSSPVVFALILVAISRYVVDRPDLAKPILEGKG
jgi:hypothetical protein